MKKFCKISRSRAKVLYISIKLSGTWNNTEKTSVAINCQNNDCSEAQILCTLLAFTSNTEGFALLWKWPSISGHFEKNNPQNQWVNFCWLHICNASVRKQFAKRCRSHGEQTIFMFTNPKFYLWMKHFTVTLSSHGHFSRQRQVIYHWGGAQAGW